MTIMEMPFPLFVASVAGLWLWLGGAFLSGWVASEKQRNPLVWFVFAVALTPLLALVALTAAPDGD